MVAEVSQYHAQGDAEPPTTLAVLDLLATDALLTYGSHLLHGRMNPRRRGTPPDPTQQDMDFVAQLQHALETDRLPETLNALLPRSLDTPDSDRRWQTASPPGSRRRVASIPVGDGQPLQKGARIASGWWRYGRGCVSQGSSLALPAKARTRRCLMTR